MKGGAEDEGMRGNREGVVEQELRWRKRKKVCGRRRVKMEGEPEDELRDGSEGTDEE